MKDIFSFQILIILCMGLSVSVVRAFLPSTRQQHQPTKQVSHLLKTISTRSTSSQLYSTTSNGKSKKTTSEGEKKRKKKGARFTQTVYQKRSKRSPSSPSAAGASDNNMIDKDRMWRNQKSIEELESKLTSRWGTDLSPWTSQDPDDEDQWELVDESDNDDTVVLGPAPKVRSKPVKDPWLMEELKEDTAQSSTSKKSSSIFGTATENDPMLRRVQTNQQRLQEQRQQTSNQQNKKKDNNNNILKVDHLIASEPAGGRGTNQPTKEATTFFFTPPEQQQQPAPVEEEPIQESTRKDKRGQGQAILDGSGNPIYLTMDQAERNFQTMLKVENSNDDKSAPPRVIESLLEYQPILQPETRSWEELGITHPILLRNLERMGCSKPLQVQDNSCPDIISGEKDVLIGTYTGSGKTLAFLVPTIQRLLDDSRDDDGGTAFCRLLIVAPGRELASQIVSVARELLQDITNLPVMLAIGGTTFGRNLEQIRKRKPPIIVGTPGRVAELIVGQPGEKKGRLRTSNLQALVLDEFDALLEYKPHRDPTHAILDALQRQQGGRLQSILCSATTSDMLGSKKSSELEQYLRTDYVTVMADQDDVLVTKKKKDTTTRVSRTVIHGVVHVPHRRFALDTVRRILHTEPLPQQILIFAETSRKVTIVVEKLEEMGIIAAPLHGGMGSEKTDRAAVSQALREGYVGIVVATEMAARGLDAPLLSHVINLDLPTDASHYAHRAGRCGRGGRPGVVINLTVTPQERKVPQRFADSLGIEMHTVEVRNGKLNIVDPESIDVD